METHKCPIQIQKCRIYIHTHTHIRRKTVDFRFRNFMGSQRIYTCGARMQFNRASSLLMRLIGWIFCVLERARLRKLRVCVKLIENIGGKFSFDLILLRKINVRRIFRFTSDEKIVFPARQRISGNERDWGELFVARRETLRVFACLIGGKLFELLLELIRSVNGVIQYYC